MRRAPAWGADTIWIGSGPRPAAGSADHVLWVESDDPMVPATGRFVLMYHLLWELTHVCFEHPGLLTGRTRSAPTRCASPASDEGRLGRGGAAPDEPSRRAGPHRRRRGGRRRHLVGSVRGQATWSSCTPARPSPASTSPRCRDERPTRAPTSSTPSSRREERRHRQRCWPIWRRRRGARRRERTRLQRGHAGECDRELQLAGAAMADRFARGRPAVHVRQRRQLHRRRRPWPRCSRPPPGRPLPAWSLAADQAVVTALGNDVGFELVFSRQIIAHAQAGDIAIGLSTSGDSDNLMHGVRRGPTRGLLTIGFAGYDGGRDGDQRRRRPLLRRPLPEHPPDPGEPGAGRYQLWSSCRKARHGRRWPRARPSMRRS